VVTLLGRRNGWEQAIPVEEEHKQLCISLCPVWYYTEVHKMGLSLRQHLHDFYIALWRSRGIVLVSVVQRNMKK